MHWSTTLQILATVSAVNPEQEELASSLINLVKENREKRDLLENTWRALDATHQLRQLARGAGNASIQLDFNMLTQVDDKILWQGQSVGRVQTFYKPMLPVEWQARIAYESFIDRFITFTQKKSKVLRLREDDNSLDLFIPYGSQFDLAVDWQAFVEEAFSVRELQKTLVLLLNSVKLSQRGGFSVLAMPVLTHAQAKVLSAFYVANMAARQAGLKRLESNIREEEEKLDTLRVGEGKKTKRATREDSVKKQEEKVADLKRKLSVQTERYAASIQAMAELEKRFDADFRELKSLARGFTSTARQQLKVTEAVVRNYVVECERLLTLGDNLYRLDPLLNDGIPTTSLRMPSDYDEETCFVCGRDFRSKQDRFEANKLVLPSPSQSLQSNNAQVQPYICGTCSALAIASPLKLSDQSLVIRLRESSEDGRYLLEDQLRMFVLGEMNIFAGRYVMVSANEKIDGDPMIGKLGGAQYALWKVASIFPPDVFNRYHAEAIVQGTKLDLSSRHLASLSALLDVASSLRYSSSLQPNEFRALGQAIRYIQKEEVIFAIYVLLCELSQKYGVVQMSHLEDLRKAYVQWLENDSRRSNMSDLVEKARLFRDVAGLTGMLFAFANYVQSEARKVNRDVEREVEKLLEKVDEPNHFTYEAAGNIPMTSATLWRDASTHFIYDEARAMLETIGVNPSDREKSEGGKSQLQFYFDDINKVYTWLFEHRYKTDKDQREFTYQLKLSLYSRFPEYLKSKPKEA